MSAGFGAGFTRQFCPNGNVETRLQAIEKLMGELKLDTLRDFIHSKDDPHSFSFRTPEHYQLVEFRRTAGEIDWRWCTAEERQAVLESLGPHWSESASFEDAFLICDEETSLVLSGMDSARLNSRGKVGVSGLFPEKPQMVVIRDTSTALAELEERLESDELSLTESSRSTLERALGMMKACLEHRLAFYLDWGG